MNNIGTLLGAFQRVFTSHLFSCSDLFTRTVPNETGGSDGTETGKTF